jgi:hypothetical protein
MIVFTVSVARGSTELRREFREEFVSFGCSCEVSIVHLATIDGGWLSLFKQTIGHVTTGSQLLIKPMPIINSTVIVCCSTFHCVSFEQDIIRKLGAPSKVFYKDEDKVWCIPVQWYSSS